MPEPTLDPTQDIVFKLLLSKRRNKPLLISLLTAVLEPKSPIQDVEVLNETMSKETVGDKGAVLDVFARIVGGDRANVEMQTRGHAGFRKRSVFYLAKSHCEQLSRGQDHAELVPTHSVFFLDFKELETQRYHSKFRLLELQEHTLLNEDLTLHYIELPKLPARPPAANDPLVLKWAKFFAAKTDEEREQVAMTDPAIRQAKEALDELSADPEARALAFERERAAWNRELTRRLERDAGREEGERGLRNAIVDLCAAFGIQLSEEQQTQLSNARLDDLQRLHHAIAVGRRWPDP